MIKFTRDENGQTLIIVTVVVTLLLFLTSVLMMLLLGRVTSVYSKESAARAAIAAESGLERTIAGIIHNPNWYHGLPIAGAEDGFYCLFDQTEYAEKVTYAVDAQKLEQDIGTSIRLNSVGKCQGGNGDLLARKTLQAEFGVFEVVDYFAGVIVLPDGGGPLENSGNILINGNLVVNGDVELNEKLQVNGNVYASGGITGYCTGIKKADYVYIPPFPNLSSAYYLERAWDEGHVYYASKAFPDEEATGPVAAYQGFYYVDGDIDITGDYCGRALLFATGDIHVAGNLVPRAAPGEPADFAAGSLTLVALGDVYIDGEVCANILAGGTLYAENGAVLRGSVCARGIQAGEGDYAPDLTVQYESALSPLADAVIVRIKTILWKELYPVF